MDLISENIIKYLETPINKVDYIILRTGYTSRLIHNPKASQQYGVFEVSPPRWSGETSSVNSKKDLIALNQFTETEPVKLRFFLPGQWDLWEGSPKRALNEEIDPEFVEEYAEMHRDCYQVVMIADRIWGDGVYTINHSQTKELLDHFADLVLYGTITFSLKDQPVSEDQNQLFISDYTKFARSINIGYCACYQPLEPENITIHRRNGLTVMVVSYDCESG